MIEERTWPKFIQVDKRIVKILSSSTYENFPSALKELITNSYDADASSVNITVDVKKESILIEDDGKGMSEEDFGLYLRIAGIKREKKPKTSSGRNVIGQFGVGFLSVFPFFKNFSIETTKGNSDEVLTADIPCHLYFGKNSIDIGEIKIQGGIHNNKSKSRQHYTRIRLSGFTELTQQFFKRNIQIKPRQGSILNKSGVEILKWSLLEDLPIQYEDKNLNKIFDKFSPNLPFLVKVNNDVLKRKSYGKEILEIHKGNYNQIGKIKFRYFIATDRTAVNEPIEGRYLKIRNLNVGVGERTTFGLGTEFGGARSRLQWLTGEVHIIEGMNELITVSRDKFNFDTDYEELKEFFITRLSFHSNQLEEEKKVSDFVQNTRDNTKISNIKFLDPKKLSRTISKLERSKAEKKYIEDTYETKTAFKAAIIPQKEEVHDFEKKIVFEGKTYKVHLDSWKYKTEFFPACRIKDGVLFINSSYPLFKRTKHTDIFIKIHLFLISGLNKKLLTRHSFEILSKEVLKFYKDYI